MLLLPILSLPQKTAFIPRFSLAEFLYLYFLILLIFSNKNSLICIPHELCGAATARTGNGCGNGRYGQLLRGSLRISGRQVHQLYGGEAHHHEPLQHHASGTEHREDRLPEKPYSADMERVGHEDYGTGVPHRGTDGDGLLRCLLPRF